MASRPQVLLIEGDRLLRLALRHKLLREGYSIDEAEEVGQSIDCMTRTSYDLVLTGLRLRDGSGLEVVRLAKRLDPRVEAIVLCSSEDDDPELSEFVRDGVVSVLVTPCTLSDLAAEAHALVARRLENAAP